MGDQEQGQWKVADSGESHGLGAWGGGLLESGNPLTVILGELLDHPELSHLEN